MYQIWQIGFLTSLLICGYAIALEEKGNRVQEAVASLAFSALWPLVLFLFGYTFLLELSDEGSIRGAFFPDKYRDF